MAPDSPDAPDPAKAVQHPLGMLFSEMEALVRIIPAQPDVKTSGRAEDVALMEEDAVEAGFDNLPV
ncbi:hypothetical protein RNZ50_10135 [Paracoccaceae bacterium Fryx2]|nr:hypothetical protein [Paracoccaceae bacterium Fryx2]